MAEVLVKTTVIDPETGRSRDHFGGIDEERLKNAASWAEAIEEFRSSNAGKVDQNFSCEFFEVSNYGKRRYSWDYKAGKMKVTRA